MARTFATTTDRVNFGAKSSAGFTTFSISFWFKAPTAVLQQVAFSWQDLITINFLNGTDCPLDLDFASSRAGKWTSSIAQHGMTMSVWNHVGWTHDSSNVANDPILYCNGVTKAFTEGVIPTQTMASASKAIRIGNYSSDTLAFGGTLAYFSLHNVILTAGEMTAAMRYGYTPRGLQFFAPLWGDATERDYSGLAMAGTVTGATVAPGPPVRYGLLAHPGYGNQFTAEAPPGADHTHYDFEVSAGSWSGTRSLTFAHGGVASLRAEPGTGSAIIWDGIYNMDISAYGPLVWCWVYVPAGSAGTYDLAVAVQRRSDFGVDSGTPITATKGAWNFISYEPPPATLLDTNQLGVSVTGAGRSAGEFIYIDDYQQGTPVLPPAPSLLTVRSGLSWG